MTTVTVTIRSSAQMTSPMIDRNEIERRRSFLRSNWDLLKDDTSDQNQGVAMPDMQKPLPSPAVIVDLVPAEDLPACEKTIMQGIADRESRRKFLPDPLTVEELSFLLWATQGVRRVTPNYSRRSAPSAGARHSIETYIFADSIVGVAKGLYRYLALQHKLCLVADSQDLADRIDEGLHGQRWDSPATFIWTAIPYRMEWRYSIASHKLIALDAGHICQNLYLACEAISCGTCAIGAYDQEILDLSLGIDGIDEFAVYAAPVGKV
jgi:SagB-type dehydrogenase family enzyme